MYLRTVFGIATLVFALAASSFGYPVFVGPSDSEGHIYLTPPSEAEMQKMLDERLERHGCMHKSSDSQLKTGESADALIVTQPTSNMYDYDVLYYKIDVAIDFSSETVDGYVEVACSSLVDGLATADLTLTDGLTVTDVRVNGVSKSFTHGGDILTTYFTESLDAGDEFMLRVEYNGPPTYYNLDGMDFSSFNGRAVCYTNCEPWGARNWWPCKDFPFDKPDSADIIITHPTSYGGYPMECVSNGLLQSTDDNGNGTTTTHWFEKHPITTYLVAIVVTDFDRLDQQWEYEPGQYMQVEHNYYPGVPPSATWGSTYYMANYTIPSLDALSHWWGMYPFVDEKYGHMHYGWGGAMEHQTSTSIGPYFDTEYVIAHELGHQWAGDQITCSPFNHMWLNEGFASYSEVLYFEYRYGWPTGKSWLMGQRHLNAGTPYVENLQTDDVFDGTTVYDKASWLVHMLRHQMGDDVFFPAMQYYFHESEYVGRSANTEQFSQCLSDFTGTDWSWFFDAWVYQEGQPDYEYSYIYEENTKSSDYSVTFYLAQNNSGGVFPMNVDIVAYAGAYDSAFTVWNGTVGDIYTFTLPNAPDSFEIDPDDKILKTVKEVEWTMHIAVGDLPDPVYGEPYSFTFTAIGGTPPYTWEKTLGQFPYGLGFNSETGELSGTPAWTADYYFKLQCTDSSNPPLVEERGYGISVVEPSVQTGDCDNSGGIDIDDVVFLINYIFAGGPAPDPIEVGDVDCSGGVDIDDAVYLIGYIFSGGPAPC